MGEAQFSFSGQKQVKSGIPLDMSEENIEWFLERLGSFRAEWGGVY
jgi:hypothetical protein